MIPLPTVNWAVCNIRPLKWVHILPFPALLYRIQVKLLPKKCKWNLQQITGIMQSEAPFWHFEIHCTFCFHKFAKWPEFLISISRYFKKIMFYSMVIHVKTKRTNTCTCTCKVISNFNTKFNISLCKQPLKHTKLFVLAQNQNYNPKNYSEENKCLI